MSKMTPKRLLDLIDAWGSDVAVFPEAEQAAARHLLAAQPDTFASALSEARRVEQLLRVLPDIAPSAELSERLIALAPVQRKAASVRTRRVAWPGWSFAGAAAALVVGIVAGVSLQSPPAPANDEGVESYVYAALGMETYTDYAEVSE